TAANVRVFRAAFTSLVSIGPEYPGIALRDLVAVLIEKIGVVDLLKGPTCKAGLVLDQVLQICLRGDDVTAQNGLVPCPVRAGPHGVNARETAAIARRDAA